MAAPLDTLESAVNLARVRLNDAIASVGGDVLTDSQPFTSVNINGAWRRLQEYAVAIGYSWLTREVVIPNIPIVYRPDPALEVYLGWDGFHDGNSLSPTPVLPANMIAPTDLWERASATAGRFYTMDLIRGGLPPVSKQPLNQRWEWRNGAIYMPGAMLPTDLRIRYSAFLADFVPAATTPFAGQNIPIPRLANPLAWYICSEVAHARGDTDTEYFDSQAKAATDLALTADGEVVPQQ